MCGYDFNENADANAVRRPFMQWIDSQIFQNDLRPEKLKVMNEAPNFRKNHGSDARSSRCSCLGSWLLFVLVGSHGHFFPPPDPRRSSAAGRENLQSKSASVAVDGAGAVVVVVATRESRLCRQKSLGSPKILNQIMDQENPHPNPPTRQPPKQKCAPQLAS